MNQITVSQAWAIATVLNEACMDVQVLHDETVPGPVFRGATGAQVVAAASALIARHGTIGEALEAIDWLMVSFEETKSARFAGEHFTSRELVWSV